MKRNIPPCPTSFPQVKDNDHYPNTESDEYKISVITPIFGGGVKTNENDPVPATVIRGSSIRGHLRFWWRATRGAEFADAKKLRDREGEIWGTTKNPSPVVIEVTVERDQGSEFYASLCKNEDPRAYVLFPMRDAVKKQQSDGELRKNVKFTLTVRYPADEETDVKAAIWAWVNFGGIGARTRRGCGALFCEKMASPSASRDDLKQWLNDAKERYKISFDRQARAWPTLFESLLTSSSSQRLPNPTEAWKGAVKLMQEFRQGGTVGRKGKFGRSNWPEADCIRSIVAKHDGKYKTNVTLDESKWEAGFPRARLGLPIIFHFEKEPRHHSTLLPKLDKKVRQRMASPLILRPLATGDGKKALSMVLQLRTLPLDDKLRFGLELKLDGVKAEDEKGLPDFPSSDIRIPEISQSEGSPLRRCSDSGSALEAFIAFAKEPQQGFEEVKL